MRAGGAIGADPFVGVSGVYYHAEQLWTASRDLAQRFKRAEEEADPSRWPAGVSVILFTAFAIETWLNEVTFLASQHSTKHAQRQCFALPSPLQKRLTDLSD